MAARKPKKAEEATPSESQDAIPPNEPPASSESQEQAQTPAKSKWVSRFGIWGDYEAGVRLIEDRQNRRMTIKFAEKPSDAVRALVKSQEHGFRFDVEDQVWYKPINPAKQRQCREEAEQLAYQAANMIREERGMEQKTYGIDRRS